MSAQPQTPGATSQPPPARVEGAPSPISDFPEPISLEDNEQIFKIKNFSFDERQPNFAYNGYTFATRDKRIKFRDGGEEMEAEQSDIVVIRAGKVVRRFEGMSYGLGVATRFGLFPFLGGTENQVVIEQTVNRGENYWIIDVAGHEPHLLYDGGGLAMADFDDDGVMELFRRIETFWFFYNLNNVNSPFPTAVLKYDKQGKKYLLANRQFASYVLSDVDEATRIVEAKRPTSEQQKEPVLHGSGIVPDHKHADYLGAVLSVMLDYIYAGKEAEGWAFYEREYNLSDKERLRHKIKSQLAGDEVYKQLYAR
ncbi:MAG: hypothetical protein WKF74_10045 [Pyrinomonadaceae bacterium]